MKINVAVRNLIDLIFSQEQVYEESDPQQTAIKARKLEDYRYLHLLDKFRH
jgi:hypothetical protein